MIVEFIITFLASFLIWFLFLGLLVLWIIDGKIKKEQALHSLMSSTIAWTIANMIKSIFPVPRPFEVHNLPTYTISGFSTDGSFPSSHSAVAFALAYTLFLHDKRLGLYFSLGAVGVGVGRVLANVHFFADIIGGAVIGILIAVLIDKIHLYKLVTKNR